MTEKDPEKERRTVTLDKDVNQYLDNEDNASAVVNRAVAAWRQTGGDERAALQIRLDRVNDDITDLRSRLEDKIDLRDELREEMERLEEVENEAETDTWTQAMDTLQFDAFESSGTYIQSSPAVVERFADELDMDVEAFRDEAIRRHEEGDDA